MYFCVCFPTDCESGHYGISCSGTCHCADDASCNAVKGTCPGGTCADGFEGEACQSE